MAANIGQHGSLLDHGQGQMVDFRPSLWQTPLPFAENRHDTNGPCEVEFSTGTNLPVVQKLLDHLTRDLVSVRAFTIFDGGLAELNEGLCDRVKS